MQLTRHHRGRDRGSYSFLLPKLLMRRDYQPSSQSGSLDTERMGSTIRMAWNSMTDSVAEDDEKTLGLK